jgi:glycosyltransferase involved in cell wall biosynthesis
MFDTLYIVIPCYNEEDVLPEASSRIKDKLLRMIDADLAAKDSRILFVDDGSRDKTWQIIENLHNSDPIFSAVKLARNKGHQNALFAGLMTAKELADVVISMDADLQDDIECLDEFMREHYDGCDIVYGVRKDRKSDTFFKRCTARLFYRIMGALGVNIVYNHADYRLMSKRALEGLASFNEVNMFLRGIVPLIGFKTATVEYARGERFAGESKYPLRKMLSFAWDGISSFSVRPIRLVVVLGFLVSLASVGLMVYYFVVHFLGRTVPGWSTLAVSIWFLGGVQLLSLGIIGEYIGKIYSEVKARPRYLVETILGLPNSESYKRSSTARD